MKKIACIYFEGNDSKVALFEKENDKIKMLKAVSIDTSLAFAANQAVPANKKNGSDKQKDTYTYDYASDETSKFNQTFLQKLNEFFINEDLNKCAIIPVLCEPAIYFQKINNEKELASLNVNAKGKIQNVVDFVSLSDESKLAVYPSGNSNYLQALDSLARLNNKRFLKIPTVKSAEISLATYISRRYEFDPSDITLVLYVGKEYSKLPFLKGNKLQHISPALPVGRNSFNAHNVIVSKILLEMEQAALSNINNILVCGEDVSDELKKSLKEAYPTSKVAGTGIENIEVIDMDSFSTDSAFIVPVAAADEYFAELDHKLSGINLLPSYVKEQQKLFQLGWQSYLMIALIFLSAFFFAFRIYSNTNQMKQKDTEIKRMVLIQERNRATVSKIKSYENKIKNVDQTKGILNQLSSGTGLLSATVEKLSKFTDQRRNMWIGQIALDQNHNLKISGYTLSRIPVKTLSDSYKKSLLKNIIFEPLRDYRVFKFSIDAGNLIGGQIQNEPKK